MRIMCVCLVALLLASAVRAEQLTNDDIVAMVKAEVAADLVINKIKTCDNMFDVSAASMAQLRAAGVSDAIIQVMLNEAQKRQARRESGIGLDIQSLASDIPETRQFAYMRLLRAGPRATEKMLDALTHADPKVRAAIIEAFIRMEKKDAATLIRVMLDDRAAVVRLAAAEFLALFDAAHSGKRALDNVMRWRVDIPTRPLDADIRLLGLLRQKEALTPLRIIMQESNLEDVRFQAAWAIGEMKDDASRQFLNRLLVQDRSPKVRLGIAQVLSTMPDDDKTVEAYRQALDIDRKNRTELLRLAAFFPVKAMVPALITMLPEKLEDKDVEALLDSLRRMTHQDFGRDVSKWLAWWEQNEQRLVNPIQPELEHDPK